MTAPALPPCPICGRKPKAKIFTLPEVDRPPLFMRHCTVSNPCTFHEVETRGETQAEADALRLVAGDVEGGRKADDSKKGAL